MTAKAVMLPWLARDLYRLVPRKVNQTVQHMLKALTSTHQ